MPWPITVSDLNLTSSVLPDVLEQFLTHIMTGGKGPSRRVSRLVSSLGQDICRTNGKLEGPQAQDFPEMCEWGS